MRKKGMAGQTLLEMILVIILLVVIVYLIVKGVSAPGIKLSACENYGGSCREFCTVFENPSNLGCKEKNKICCIDPEKVILKEGNLTGMYSHSCEQSGGRCTYAAVGCASSFEQPSNTPCEPLDGAERVCCIPN